MNIKSLLIGSAAALVAVSGARAADAVMAPEPEPVEYVRICDAYGAGFFYIPGTETCLSISGQVYYQISTSSFDNDFVGGTPPMPGSVAPAHTGYSASKPNWHIQGWHKMIQARVNFDARSETEWGTLRSFIRFQAEWNGDGDGEVKADQAYIELGGLKMGYSESYWVGPGRAGPLQISGSHSPSGLSYGYQQRALIGYTFGGNGFQASLSLEDDALSGEGYMPDVVAAVGYGAAWGAVWAKIAYDESWDGTVVTAVNPASGLTVPLVNDGGFSAQIGAQINMPNMPGSSLRVIGYWADSANAFNVGGPSTFLTSATSSAVYNGAEWSILASYRQQFSQTVGASIGFQWYNDLYYAGTSINSGVNGYAAELAVDWTPVQNFKINAELAYRDVGAYRAPSRLAGLNPDGTVSGFVRFTRSF